MKGNKATHFRDLFLIQFIFYFRVSNYQHTVSKIFLASENILGRATPKSQKGFNSAATHVQPRLVEVEKELVVGPSTLALAEHKHIKTTLLEFTVQIPPVEVLPIRNE